jgi:glucose-1-phosphate thymidylyltransferase
MKAVVLAAGEGNRLRPLTGSRPKPMVPVANRPLLTHVVEAVVETGIDEVVLVVGYGRERIQSYFGDGDDWGVDIEYAIQEKQLGTGHALLQAESHVDGPFVALNGDRIIDPSAVTTLRDRDDAPVVSVCRSETPADYGVVELDGDRLVSLVEKPPAHRVTTDLINAGVYRFDPTIFEEIRRTEPAGELALTAALRRLAETGTVRAVRYDGQWLDVSHLWDLPAVNARMLDRAVPDPAPRASVADAAVVAGPVALGADARVRPNATVLSGCSLGENVEVAPGAVLDNTVLFPDATVGPGTVLRDCVVGENATVGPNVTVEGGHADVVVEGDLHADVRLGGVVGDRAAVGGAVTLDPGTVLGTGVEVASGATVGGRVPDGAFVRRG